MTGFENIYNYYFRDVYLYIKGLSKDESVAEDITSETFIKAMEPINSFNGSCDIRVCLCQIAKNIYFSYLRKNNKLTFIDAFQDKKDDIDIEKSFHTTETSMKIHEILHNLEDPYKEVFSLRTFGELSFKQIAFIFNKNENWACVVYHRVRNKIKEKWRNLNEN